MDSDMKSNTVEYEAVGKVNDVSVKVKAVASATGPTYEEAWLKAQAAAKSDADSKLVDVLKKIENNGSVTEIVIKGDPGPPGPIGYTGNRGTRGAAGSDGKDLTHPTINVDSPLSLSAEALDTISAIANTKLTRDTNPNCLQKSVIKDKINNTFGPLIDFINNVDACLKMDSVNNTCNLTFDNTQETELTGILNTLFKDNTLFDLEALIGSGFFGLTYVAEPVNRSETFYYPPPTDPNLPPPIPPTSVLSLEAMTFIDIPTPKGSIDFEKINRIKMNLLTTLDESIGIE